MTNLNPLLVRELGRRHYEEVWQAMRDFTDTRDSATPDELWLVEHDPVFTLGQAGRLEHVLAPGNIPVIKVERGGQVTYHGPGQQVVYLLIDLHRRNLGIRQLVCIIEKAILNMLADFGIQGELRPNAPGVYVNHAKIAALGLRVRRGCSFHGLALNVAMDLEPFQRINPCGYPGLSVVDMKALIPSITLEEIKAPLINQLRLLLEKKLEHAYS